MTDMHMLTSYCPQINLFQPLRLRAQIKILSNVLSATERHPRKEPGITRNIEKRSR